VAIILEVGFASDIPHGEKKEQGEICLGSGPILSCGPNINPALFARLKATAAQEQIPVQILAEAKITGTDANVVQLSRSGVATALVRVPLRYMHTPVEVLSLDDLDAAIRLVAALLEQLGDRQELIPQ
jgi:endoglucanase